MTDWDHANSIKKPKTSRYPSLKGTDPKFRRNHRHALHGTMKALVRWDTHELLVAVGEMANECTEGGEGGQARCSVSERQYQFDDHTTKSIKPRYEHTEVPAAVFNKLIHATVRRLA